MSKLGEDVFATAKELPTKVFALGDFASDAETKAQINKLSVAQLQKLAREYNLAFDIAKVKELKKGDLVAALLEHLAWNPDENFLENRTYFKSGATPGVILSDKPSERAAWKKKEAFVNPVKMKSTRTYETQTEGKKATPIEIQTEEVGAPPASAPIVIPAEADLKFIQDSNQFLEKDIKALWTAYEKATAELRVRAGQAREILKDREDAERLEIDEDRYKEYKEYAADPTYPKSELEDDLVKWRAEYKKAKESKEKAAKAEAAAKAKAAAKKAKRRPDASLHWRDIAEFIPTGESFSDVKTPFPKEPLFYTQRRTWYKSGSRVATIEDKKQQIFINRNGDLGTRVGMFVGWWNGEEIDAAVILDPIYRSGTLKDSYPTPKYWFDMAAGQIWQVPITAAEKKEDPDGVHAWLRLGYVKGYGRAYIDLKDSTVYEVDDDDTIGDFLGVYCYAQPDSPLLRVDEYPEEGSEEFKEVWSHCKETKAQKDDRLKVQDTAKKADAAPTKKKKGALREDEDMEGIQRRKIDGEKYFLMTDTNGLFRREDDDAFGPWVGYFQPGNDEEPIRYTDEPEG